ncbi:AAA domain-containing protein [Desulfurobacterium indicum]|uniref:DNA helicase n=1 Tax=Desulfurobacterium indicum TaxID=1914305 RepID=A0A1R1MMM7_9BACT|nr:AAA domain-containing protein [Desulfurobacterium indicum]OMH41078.1 hypothetical protein BLW93_01800 [Desulfurobacterium indicum]
MEYLELEKLHNLKIKAEGFDDYKRATLSSGIGIESNNRIKVEGNKLTIFIPDELKKTLNEGSQIYLGFPVLKRKRNGEETYLPLFIIKKDADKEIEKIEIDTESFSDFFVAKPVLVRALNFEPQEIDELTKKPLLSLLKDFLSLSGMRTSDADTFEGVYKEFKNWLGGKIKKSTYELASFDFVITTDKTRDFEYFEGQKVETILKDLVSDFPQPKENSAAHRYFFGEQTVGFDKYNEPSSVPWFGTFHKFELSRGQALLLQKKAEGENLIAVQGPPGTGKTTVLMAIIASTLVERAISIVKDEKDFSALILVASTANKAVENAAREFELTQTDGKKEIPKEFKEIPLYAEGYGFYFVGGKKKNIQKSLERVENLAERLKKDQFNGEEYENTKRELLKLYSSLDKTAETLKFLIEKIEEIRKLEQHLDEVETRLNEISKRPSAFSNLVNEDLKDLEENIEKTRRWLEDLNSIGFDFKNLPLLMNKDFIKSVIELEQYLQKRNIVDRIMDLFLKREKKEIEKFLIKNQKVLNVLGVNFELDAKKALQNLKKLKNLHLEAKRLLEEKPDDIYLNNLPVIEQIVDLRREKLELTEKLTIKKDQIEETLKEKGLNLQLNASELINGQFNGQLDFLKLWKLLTVETNRKLFVLASRFLYLEALRQKEDILKALDAFKLLMGNKDDVSKGREIVKDLGIEKFYRYLSLVYPVHFSSLHSAPYIFEKVKDLLKKEFYKPIHILYVDEAAMALPHLSYPSVYFSEKVISVGDPLQLEPVVAVPEDEIERFHKTFYNDNIEFINRYSPARTSTYHRTARCETGDYDDFGEACFLDAHRRCQEPIAKLFKVVAGYERLEIATPSLKGKDLERLNKVGGSHLVFVDVLKGKSTEKNTNLIEAKVVKCLVEELINTGYSNDKIIVITPFVKQEKLLQKELKGLLESKKIGTVHKFQGQEAPVVIMSTVVQKNDSTTFIDAKPNLLNVAISRAKHLFIMVGNSKRLKDTNYFGKALEFIRDNGRFIQVEGESKMKGIFLIDKDKVN